MDRITKYDVAAYVWPAFTGKEERAFQFWEQGMGEWQSVLSAESRVEGQILPRHPLWGTVDEADPSVMEFQIREALDHGVNVFIYDWYWYDRRPFLEQCLDEGFLGAPNNGEMKFYLMWANHDAGYTWDKRMSARPGRIWLGSQPREEFDRICRRVTDLYFTKPNYYTIDGCPVFMIYDVSNLMRGLGGLSETRKALDDFRDVVREAGFPGLHLQMVITGEHVANLSGVDEERGGRTEDVVTLLGFDSVTHYQFVHFTDCGRDYRDILGDVAQEWERIRRSIKVPYYPHISVGWDNNPRHLFLTEPIIRNNTPENFRKGLVMAKEYSDRFNTVPLVTINSWNEWTEMSYLEPDDVWGYGYLEAVRDVFGSRKGLNMTGERRQRR